MHWLSSGRPDEPFEHVLEVVDVKKVRTESLVQNIQVLVLLEVGDFSGFECMEVVS